VCQRMQMLGSRPGGGPPGESAPYSAPRREPQRAPSAPAADEYDAPPPDMPPADDIPF
jgi:hypothetical protein